MSFCSFLLVCNVGQPRRPIILYVSVLRMAPVQINAARRCTFSSFCESVQEQLSYNIDPYSMIGRTIFKYTLHNCILFKCIELLYICPIHFDALAETYKICFSHFMSSENTIPKCLCSVTCVSVSFLNLSSNLDFCLFKDILIKFVFLRIKIDQPI